MSPEIIVFLGGPHDGKYLRAYDPDFGGGRGLVETTSDRAQAKLYADKVEAWQDWKRQSTVLPLRPDGKPNRPLSAFTITVEPL